MLTNLQVVLDAIKERWPDSESIPRNRIKYKGAEPITEIIISRNPPYLLFLYLNGDKSVVIESVEAISVDELKRYEKQESKIPVSSHIIELNAPSVTSLILVFDGKEDNPWVMYHNPIRDRVPLTEYWSFNEMFDLVEGDFSTAASDRIKYNDYGK